MAAMNQNANITTQNSPRFTNVRPMNFRFNVFVKLISSSGQTTGGGPPAWGFGEMLTIPHRKKCSLLRNVHRTTTCRALWMLWQAFGFHRGEEFLDW